MSNKAKIKRHAKADRNKGLFIAIAASLVLIILAAYKVPLIHNELHGIIIGVSKIHDETGSRSIAAVHLDTGDQVLASMPPDLQIRTGAKARVMEGRSLFGRKSYNIVSYDE